MSAFLARALVWALPLPAMAQIAILQIRVVEGEGAIHSPGSRATRPLTVEITEETGRPVQGASVSFVLPDEGPGATFSSGLRTALAITDATGRASVRNLNVNRTPGRFEIRIAVVSEQARAGAITWQYVSDRPQARAKGTASRRKWLAVGLLAAGAATGIAAGALGGGTAATPAASAQPAPPVSIGVPAITVGRP